MLPADEKKRWGVIGRPPAEIVDAPIELTKRWKELLIEAKKVQRMRPGEAKVVQAKIIEDRYIRLVSEIKHQAAQRRKAG